MNGNDTEWCGIGGNMNDEYNVLVGKIKKAYLNAQTDSTKAVLEDILPELRESEDKRIRKEIISALKYANHKGVYDKHLAWLEKQGEQKANYTTIVETGDGGINAVVTEELSTDKVEPKFKMEKGKWYVCDTSRYTDFIVGKAYYCPKNGMLKPNENAIARYVAKDCFHLWTIQDAKDGDVLVDEDINVIGIFEGTEGMCWHSKIYYSYATKELYGIECGGSHQKEFAKPATKEQRDTLMKAMADAGYIFNFEKKELKKVEQKSAWSEDDERERKRIIGLLEGWLSTFKETCYAEDCKCGIDWLKSLKERVQPQPKQEWSEKDEAYKIFAISAVEEYYDKKIPYRKDLVDWLRSLKDRYAWKPSDEQKVM